MRVFHGSIVSIWPFLGLRMKKHQPILLCFTLRSPIHMLTLMVQILKRFEGMNAAYLHLTSTTAMHSLSQITNMVAKLDNLTKYIQEQLMAHNLDQRINVIHLSDHGMSSVVPPNFIDLRQFTAAGAFKWYGSSPILQIVPTNPCEFIFFFSRNIEFIFFNAIHAFQTKSMTFSPI